MLRREEISKAIVISMQAQNNYVSLTLGDYRLYMVLPLLFSAY